MSSLSDFNFSGDDPGPSTDPTPDPVDGEPGITGDAEQIYDDTNYKEPGVGEEFLGNEPSAFDSEGNAEDPNTQKSDVPPVEVEAETVTETKEANPVERNIDEELEGALNLLVNLGLGDYVTGIIEELLDDESDPEPEEIGKLQTIVNWIKELELQKARDNLDNRISFTGSEEILASINTNLMEEITGYLGGLGGLGADTIDELKRARANINSTIPTQSNYWRTLSRNAQMLHNFFNRSDDEDLIDEGEDQGDIDEAEGSTSPNDTDLEYIELDDWLGLSPADQDQVDYVDLNDYLAPDMHTVDEYIDLNDYMGDMIQESFLEEFMFVEQDDI